MLPDSEFIRALLLETTNIPFPLYHPPIWADLTYQPRHTILIEKF